MRQSRPRVRFRGIRLPAPFPRVHSGFMTEMTRILSAICNLGAATMNDSTVGVGGP
jgi:hypothetical protein